MRSLSSYLYIIVLLVPISCIHTSPPTLKSKYFSKKMWVQDTLGVNGYRYKIIWGSENFSLLDSLKGKSIEFVDNNLGEPDFICKSKKDNARIYQYCLEYFRYKINIHNYISQQECINNIGYGSYLSIEFNRNNKVEIPIIVNIE
jgi:hypothetical protein